MALTVKAIEKLKPDPAKRREVPDGTVGSLYLVIQPSGEKSWAVRYRYGGKPRKLTLGPLYKPDPLDKEAKAPAPVLGRPLDLKGARMLAGRALDAVASGRDPGVEKIAARRLAASGVADRDRFDTVAVQFITRYARPKNRSWLEQARYLGLKPDPADPDKLVTIPGGLADRWGDRNLGDIRKRDIIDELDARVDHAPIAANRWLATVQKMFSWAVARDLIEVSPCTGVAKPATETLPRPHPHRQRTAAGRGLPPTGWAIRSARGSRCWR